MLYQQELFFIFNFKKKNISVLKNFLNYLLILKKILYVAYVYLIIRVLHKRNIVIHEIINLYF